MSASTAAKFEVSFKATVTEQLLQNSIRCPRCFGSGRLYLEAPVNAPFVSPLATESRMYQRDAADLYGNDSAYERGRCLQSYELGQASFWTTTGMSSQRAGCLLNAVNGAQPKGYILDALSDAYGMGGDYLAALDTLIPLNERAAADLSGAYSKFGTWRDEDELLARRLRRAR